MNYKTIVIILAISLFLKGSLSQLNFPYQAHGFNDLDFFLQQMKKGVDTFKIDISQGTKEVCEKYTTWDPERDGNFCEELDYFQICCLGFRGDTSPKPILDDYFNTTWDMIRLLNDERNDFLLKRGSMLSTYNYTKYIAMNFQYSYPFSKLTRNYLYNLATTIRDRDLDIQLIFGMDDFILNYDKLCLIDNNCTAEEKAISDSNVFLQSGSPDSAPYNPKDVKGRYRNFNTFFKNLDYVCENGFPDWARDSGTPVIFWEPSDEQSVRWVMERFTSSSCKRDVNHNSTKQLRITSNLEPEMVQTFHNRFNETGDSIKVLIPNSTLVGSTKLDETKLLLLSVKTYSYELVAQLIDLENGFNIIDEQLITYNTAVKKAKFLNNYILLETNQDLEIFKINDPFSIESVLVFRKSDNFLGAAIFEDPITRGSMVGELSGSLYSQYLNIYDIEKSVLLMTIPFEVNIKNPISSDFAIAWNYENRKYEAFFSYQSKDQSRGDAVDGLYSLYFSFEHQLTRVIKFSSSLEAYDFGSQPSLNFVYSADKKLFLLQTHTNGLCQCGLEFNNNQFNKCNYHRNPKHYALLNSENMVNYIWGKYEDIQSAIASGSVINGCHQTIMHAKLYNGINPHSVGVYRNKNNQLQAFIAHDGVEYDDLPLPTRMFCGSTGLNMPEEEYKSTGKVYIHSFDVVDFELLELF